MPESAENDANDWRRLYPFASYWVETPAGQMHFVDEGAEQASSDVASTLLFVHGNPTWSFHWRQLIQALRKDHRCIAVDHIGCGLSDKPARFLTLEDHIKNLISFIERLSLKDITLVAQDWGGAIGLGALQRLHIQPSRIILFNTGAFPPRYIPWRIRMCRIPLFGRLALQGGNLFSRAALRMTLARKSHLEPAVRAGYLAPYDCWANRRAVYGFVKDIPSPYHDVFFDPVTAPYDDPILDPTSWGTLHAIEDLLPRFADRPSCLIWGMKDWCFRPDCLDRFIAVWPNADVHRLADVGHWVVEDAPDEAQAIVTDFISRKDVVNRESSHLSQRG